MRHVAMTFLLAAALVLAFGAGHEACAVTSFFDVFTTATRHGPPYATLPISAAVATEEGGGYVNHRQIDLGVGGCDDGQGLVVHTFASGHEGGGGGGGGYQVESFFDVWFDIGPQQPEAPPASFFDIFVDEMRWGSGDPGTLGVRHPDKPVDDPERYFDVYPAESFFDIYYDVYYDMTVEHYHMHGETQAGICSFFDVFVELDAGMPTASFFDVFVELHIVNGPMNTGLPALTIGTTADHDERPIGVGPATWTAVKGLFGR